MKSFKISLFAVSTFLLFLFGVVSSASAYTVNFTKNSAGSIKSSNSSLSCGSICSKDYSSGSTDSFTAFPDYGYVWKGWSGDIVSDSIAFIIASINKDYNITATFDKGGVPLIGTLFGISNPIDGNSVSISAPESSANGYPFIEKGLVWGTSSGPTVDLSTKTASGVIPNYYGSLNGYASGISGLFPNTTYYVRAYAKNEFGVGYSNEIIVKTGQPDVSIGDFLCSDAYGNSTCTSTNQNGIGSFSVRIKNIGNYSTPNTPIESRIEYASQPDGAGTIYTDYGPVHPTSGSSLLYKTGYQYVNSGTSNWLGFRPIGARHDTVSFRVCTDYDNKITESNESNNCSPWQNVYIKLAPSVSISANPNSGATGITSLISWSAYNDPQSCEASGDWSGSKTFSGSETVGPLDSSKTYSYGLTCTNSDGSGWGTATVVVSGPSPVGSLSGPDCLITTEGGNSCTTTINWSVTNPVGGAATNVTKAGNVEVANGATGPKSGITVTLPGTDFYLNHNGATLKTINIKAVCDASKNLITSADGKSCITTTSTIGTFSGTPCKIKTVGGTSCDTTLSWSITNPKSGASTDVTKPVNVKVAEGSSTDSASGIAVNLPFTLFYLNHDTKTLNLDGLKITPECDASLGLGLSSDGKSCVKITSLTGNDCTIELGKSTCPTQIAWSVANPIPGGKIAVTNNSTASSLTVSPGNSTVYYPKTTFYLYNDGNELKVLELHATCASGTEWNVANKKCQTIVTGVDGYWGDWLPSIINCPVTNLVQTRNYVPATGTGVNDPVALAKGSETRNVSYASALDCPSVEMTVKSRGIVVPPSTKIPYNTKAEVFWEGKNVTTCNCTYLDINGDSVPCGSGAKSSYKTTYLKKSTTFKVSCSDAYDTKATDEATVLVEKMMTNVTEQ